MKKTLHIGRSELNITQQKITFHAEDGNTTERKLSFRETSVLALLIEAEGAVISNQDLLLEFWGNNDFYSLNSLYVFMTRLKQTLSTDASLQIINARGIGYRLIEL